MHFHAYFVQFSNVKDLLTLYNKTQAQQKKQLYSCCKIPANVNHEKFDFQCAEYFETVKKFSQNVFTCQMFMIVYINTIVYLKKRP